MIVLNSRNIVRSNHNSFYLIQGNLIAGAVVKLRRLWAFVIGDGLSVLDGAAIFKISGDAGCPKSVAANRFG